MHNTYTADSTPTVVLN